MSQLSPKARALLHSNRDAFKPTASDRERIQHALRARLGTAVPPPRASAPVRSSWQLMSGALVSAGVLSGALFLALHHPGTAHAARIPVAPISIVQSAAPALEPAPEQPATADSATPPAAIIPAKPAASSARATQDSLAQEVALLSRATSDLHTGRPADALKILDEHRRKFPNGLLTEERRAARAQALCSLGRMTEARAELARLTPQSPAAARAKQVCAGATTSGS